MDNIFKYDSNLSYEFVLYIFAIDILNDYLSKCEDKQMLSDKKSSIYYINPQSLYNLINRIDCANEKEINNPDLVKFYKVVKEKNSFKLYKKINKAYTEYKQNNALEELNAGIDLKRFESDESYKNDTIIGLSMDLKTFELACSLAKFYSFDIWIVYMTFTEYMLTENETATLEEIEAKLNPLVDTLKIKNDEFLKVMNKNVLPIIDGKDLDKLTIYYNLLGNLNFIPYKIVYQIQIEIYFKAQTLEACIARH